jgi:murein DD-endopeptidase MepM/ murein hydrolase activator NlpD
MNDSTFEEKFSLRLSPLDLFIAVGSLVIGFIILIISIIAFTPLREYIPGYADVNIRKSVLKMALKADSLEQDAEAKDIYISNINSIISGNLKGQVSKPEKPDSSKNFDKLNLGPSEVDLNLRKQIESQDPYSLSINEAGAVKNNISSFFFFTPVKGIITSSFNIAEEHFGVDVVAPENEAIKAALDGTVIFSGWTSETGYVIQLQHQNNLVSAYKHNAANMKKTGQFVKAGEVIAIIGNSGENSTGPHLHFELWYNGSPVDPQEHIVF